MGLEIIFAYYAVSCKSSGHGAQIFLETRCSIVKLIIIYGHECVKSLLKTDYVTKKTTAPVLNFNVDPAASEPVQTILDLNCLNIKVVTFMYSPIEPKSFKFH